MTEEIAKEPSPEVVHEESGPDGIFDDDVDVPQAGLEPGQPDRREVAGHPNALDEGQAGEPQAHEARAPKQPTPEERAQHELHHANFEPWCEKCVMGQGRDKPHRRQEESKKHIIYADYMLFTKEGEIVDAESRSRRKGLVTILTGICKDSQRFHKMVG